MTNSIITSVSGTGIPLPGNDIDTDQITPARFLKEITFDSMGEALFYDLRFDENGKQKTHPLNDERFKNGTILVVGDNFGCGSSREHAPQAILRYGIKAIIGESFAEIFAGNCKALGIATATMPSDSIKALMEHIEDKPEFALNLDLETSKLWVDKQSFDVSINESRRKSFITGTWDSLTLLKSNEEKTQETARQLPYFAF